MKPSISSLAKQFLETYDAVPKDNVWEKQRNTFHTFWSMRVLHASSAPLAEEECDAIIRILDKNGKGNTKDSEAVALTRVPQGAWRRLFSEFLGNKELARLVNSIFETKDLPTKATLIDKLYVMNEGRGNSLTGQAGITLSALLAAHDPFANLSIVSLNDRRALLDFFALHLADNLAACTSVSESLALNECRNSGVSARTAKHRRLP
jgi:hypothetical protein